jgi:uncharacterized RDD family membrane protein YckC
VYCSKCGSAISATAVFCPACGQAVTTLAPPPEANLTPTGAASIYPVVNPPATYNSVLYAGFWLRFVAFLIDSLLRGFAFVLLLIPLFVLTGAGAALERISAGEDLSDNVAAFIGAGFILGFIGIISLVSWLYYALSEASSWQATPGKKLLNLYVTDMEGQPISFARASGRFFARIVTSLIPLGIGYILAGVTEKKQAIHDMLASCLVLRKS